MSDRMHHFMVDGPLELLSGQLSPGNVETGDTAEARAPGGRIEIHGAVAMPDGIAWTVLVEDPSQGVRTFFRTTAKHLLTVTKGGVS